MAAVTPIPESYPRVCPYLHIDAAANAIGFYKHVFGATERIRMDGPDGRVGHAELGSGDSVMMLADEYPDRGQGVPGNRWYGRCAVDLRRRVDATVAKAKDAGATIASARSRIRSATCGASRPTSRTCPPTRCNAEQQPRPAAADQPTQSGVPQLDRLPGRVGVRHEVWNDVRMDRVDNPEAAAVPIACTLSPDDGATRMRRWEALSEKGRPNARRRGHMLQVRYQPDLGIREELEALAAAERQCCSFVSWTVSQDQDHVVLHVTADLGAPDDVPPIAALFGAG